MKLYEIVRNFPHFFSLNILKFYTLHVEGVVKKALEPCLDLVLTNILSDPNTNEQP